jgi:hypothetical protein
VHILQYIAARMNAGENKVLMEDVATGAQVRPASLEGHARWLHDRGLARIEWHVDGHRTLQLTPPGSEWLERNGLMPE